MLGFKNGKNLKFYKKKDTGGKQNLLIPTQSTDRITITVFKKVRISEQAFGVPMLRIKRNKPSISPNAKTFRSIRRLNLNRTYTPLKVGVAVGYI